MDQGGGGGDDTGGSSQDGGRSVTPPPLNNLGLGSLDSGKVGGLGLGDLGSVNRSHRGDSVVHGGNEGLRVEGGGHQGLGVEHGDSGVSHAESGAISDVLDPLQLAVGVNIGVSTAHSGVGVADLVLDGVEVAVAVLEVAKLILGLELVAGGIGNHSGCGGDHGSGSIGGGGIGVGVATIGDGDGVLGHTSSHKGRQGNLSSDVKVRLIHDYKVPYQSSNRKNL